MQKKCVVLCGGGTGGHIYPNLALVGELSTCRRVCYIGSVGSMEEKLCREKGIEFFGINPPKFNRKFTIENFKLPSRLIKSQKEAKNILEQLNPAVIFSKGGYVSLPSCLAGIKAGIPVLCHESDLSCGLANKIAYKKGGTLLTSFPTTMAGKKRVIHTGAPLRAELFENKRKSDFATITANTASKTNAATKQSQALKKLLIIGGSQGAKSINEAVIANLANLSCKFEIIHLTGIGKIVPKEEIARQYSFMTKCELEFMQDSYHPMEYATDMKSIYKNADIAVSRGGANAVFELLESEIPTLIIPLEKNSRGDQIENAKYFSDKKLCHTLSENHMFGFFESVCHLLDNSSQIKANIKMAKQSTIFNGRENIIKLILSH